MEIKIISNYYDEEDRLYDYDSLNLEPGLTILTGCNGSGKTTLLTQISEYCKKKSIPFLRYDNQKEGDATAMSAALLSDDINGLALDAMSSEGERIINNVGRCATKMGKLVVSSIKKGEKQIFMLLDGIDSGLSIDGIIDIKENLFNFIVKDAKKDGLDVYILASSNTYELANNSRCLNVVTGEYYIPKTYERYKLEVITTYERKCQRYKIEPSFDLKSKIDMLK